MVSGSVKLWSKIRYTIQDKLRKGLCFFLGFYFILVICSLNKEKQFLVLSVNNFHNYLICSNWRLCSWPNTQNEIENRLFPE